MAKMCRANRPILRNSSRKSVSRALPFRTHAAYVRVHIRSVVARFTYTINAISETYTLPFPRRSRATVMDLSLNADVNAVHRPESPAAWDAKPVIFYYAITRTRSCVYYSHTGCMSWYYACSLRLPQGFKLVLFGVKKVIITPVIIRMDVLLKSLYNYILLIFIGIMWHMDGIYIII